MHFRPFPVFWAYVFLSGKSANLTPPSLSGKFHYFFFETFPYWGQHIKKRLSWEINSNQDSTWLYDNKTYVKQYRKVLELYPELIASQACFYIKNFSWWCIQHSCVLLNLRTFVARNENKSVSDNPRGLSSHLWTPLNHNCDRELPLKL